MKSDRFYLACLRDNVGSNVSFHCKDGKGYSTDIDRAHTYTREEAQKAWDLGREYDLPLCADRVDALAKYHVDSQLIPSESEKAGLYTLYVAYEKQRWDGNDVYWLRSFGLPTTNFNEATLYPYPGRNEGLVWIGFETAEAAKRRTFNSSLVDRRRMIQSAGLLTPEHVKRHRRRRPDSGKTRWNCPSCGRIHWQYNPHDFEGCSNIECEEWKPLLSRGAA